MMAARNRNRPGLVKEDADEERSLWNQIRSESKRIDDLIVRIIFVSVSARYSYFCLFDLVSNVLITRAPHRIYIVKCLPLHPHLSLFSNLGKL